MATHTSMRIDLAPAPGAPPAAGPLMATGTDLALAAPLSAARPPPCSSAGATTRAGDKAPLPPGDEGFGVRGGQVSDFADTAAWKAWLRSAPAGLARFVIAGGALGFAGFWIAPVTIDALSGYDRAVFGATLFLFIGWTFINLHHYFMDNVIGRRENPETLRHRFTPFGRPDPQGTGRPTHASAGTAGTLRSTPDQGAFQS